jgi:beta-lactamase regulating signal transducer with metallopeptidase domain/protocatechuate 3,4-dioxygenase beta subunit/Leucine-rich repeat (LRR) protein
MNASFTAFSSFLIDWLLDYYLAATVLLLILWATWRWVRQPAHRIAAAWTVTIELLVLAAACALPFWPRISLVAATLPKTVASGVPESSSIASAKPQEVLEADANASRAFGAPIGKLSGPSVEHSQVEKIIQPPPPPRIPWTWPELFAVAYLAGAMAIALWLYGGIFAAWRICRQSRAADESLMALLSKLPRGNNRTPRLLVSSRIGTAVALGVFRPTVVLPSALVEKRPSPALLAVLAHECAHLQHRDLWLLALGRCLLPLVYAHPLYWWFRRAIRHDQELLADALAAGENRADYAEELLSLVRDTTRPPLHAAAAAVGLWEGSSQITRRIAMLLDETFCIQPKGSRRRKFQVLGLMLLLGGACSLLTLQPARSGEEPKKPAAAEENKSTEALTYSGRVTDKTTGKPIAGATVTVRRKIVAPFERRTIEEPKYVTDVEGKYTFTISPEQVAQRYLYIELDVAHPDYASRRGFGYALSMIRKNEKLGERPFFESVAMHPADQVTGTVETPDDKPAGNIVVYGFSMPDNRDFDSASFTETATDAQGAFRLNVTKGSKAVFWLLPKEYAPSTHAIDEKHGDVGRLKLEKGVIVKGRVMDVAGKPVAGVFVNAHVSGGPAKKSYTLPVADMLARAALSGEKGEFTLAPLPVGEYLIRVEEYAHDHLLGRPDPRPVPYVFTPKKLAIKGAETDATVEIRAAPEVRLEGQYFDSSGKTRTGHEPQLWGFVDDKELGENEGFYSTEGEVDKNGRFIIRAPKGLLKAKLDFITNEHSALRIRMSKDAPLGNQCRDIELGTLEQDRKGIEVVRYEAPILQVKPVGENGALLKNAKVAIEFPLGKGPWGGPGLLVEGKDVSFERQDDGYRRTSQLLPDEEFTLTVGAEGYRSKSEKLKLTEGELKKIEVNLQKEDAASAASGNDSPPKEESKIPNKPKANSGNSANSKSTPKIENERGEMPQTTAKDSAEEKLSFDISGTVVDGETGKPVQNFFVQGGQVDKKDPAKITWGFFEQRTTSANKEGRYSLHLDWGGGWRARIVAGGYVPQPILDKALPAGTTRIDKHVVRLKRGREIQGRVVYHDGKPAADAAVFLIVEQGGGVSITGGKAWQSFGPDRTEDKAVTRATADAEGRFKLPGGNAKAIAVSAPRVDLWVVPAPEPTADEKAELTINLPEPGRLKVKYDIEGGDEKAALFMQMNTWDAQTPAWRGIDNIHEPAAPNKGEVTIDNLPPGKYELSRKKPAKRVLGVGTHFADRRTIEIASGKTTESDFIRDRGTAVEGQIEGLKDGMLAGGLKPGAIVSVRSPAVTGDLASSRWKEPIFDIVVCGPDGKFKTERLLPGEYSIIAEAFEAEKPEERRSTGIRLPAFVGRAAVTVPESGPPPQVKIEIKPRVENKSVSAGSPDSSSIGAAKPQEVLEAGTDASPASSIPISKLSGPPASKTSAENPVWPKPSPAEKKAWPAPRLAINGMLNLDNYDGSEAWLLEKIQESKQEIEVLSLSNTKFSDSGLPYLKELPNLAKLHLGNTKITDAGLKYLGDIPRLKELNLRYNIDTLKGKSRITGAGLATLKNARTLTHLRLDGTWIDDAGLERLKEFPQLEMLSLGETRTTDKGLKHLVDLPKLRVLNLGQNDISDAGLAQLGKISTLEMLWLGNVEGITDDGLAHLAGLARLRDLSFFGDRQITDAGLAHLKNLSRLEKLDLVACNVSDEGLKHLVGLKNLKQLNLQGSHVTAEGRKKLQEALPDCKVYGSQAAAA